jgi:hypothetical protein
MQSSLEVASRSLTRSSELAELIVTLSKFTLIGTSGPGGSNPPVQVTVSYLSRHDSLRDALRVGTWRRLGGRRAGRKVFFPGQVAVWLVAGRPIRV